MGIVGTFNAISFFLRLDESSYVRRTEDDCRDAGNEVEASYSVRFSDSTSVNKTPSVLGIFVCCFLPTSCSESFVNGYVHYSVLLFLRRSISW